MTQDELARAAGIARTYISEIECGGSNLTVVILFKILHEVGYGIFLVEDKKAEKIMKVLENYNNISKINLT